ncbi:MAG: translation initiation factor IF-2 [Acholeplasmatales bacterium]|jgi:translation initiation factor IF-2|nr:translation initiation factor IF-2 [Acholeplasmatales bacterium]
MIKKNNNSNNNNNNNNQNQNYNRKPRNNQNNRDVNRVFTYKTGMTLREVSEGLNIVPGIIIQYLMKQRMLVNINQVLEKDLVEIIVNDFGYKLENEKLPESSFLDGSNVEYSKEEVLERRPAVVTIMGHVDHGKTSLLDAIRNSRVIAGEAGGITQHIGAYQVKRKNGDITFIDTPGHAAFAEMRARGAKMTDIVVLVVAADDGVMPQTKEALNHALAANVKIIVAINKIDKSNANPDKVRNELINLGLLPDNLGGNTPFIPISALRKQGIEDILDAIELISEIEEYKASYTRAAAGIVIESNLDKGMGPEATLLVQHGTLKVGDYVVVGNVLGKIRTMVDDFKRPYKQATPSQPVVVSGLESVPEAGDRFLVFSSQEEAKKIAAARVLSNKNALNSGAGGSLEDILNRQTTGDKELNVIIKADVQGSIQAIKNLLESIKIEDFRARILASSVGAINENDINLAFSSNSIIVAFNIRPSAAMRQSAESKKVDIKSYEVVYRLEEDIRAALEGRVAPEMVEKIIGQAEVRQLFSNSKVGKIAGCMVTDGIITRDSKIRLLRDQKIIYEGRLASLKHLKDDAKEVRAGFECGLSIKNFDDIKEGDIIEASLLKEVE